MNLRGFLNTGVSIVVIISFLVTGQYGTFTQTALAQDDIKECTEDDYLLWHPEDSSMSTIELTDDDRFRANISTLSGGQCFWESGSATTKGLKATEFDDSARKSYPQITASTTYSTYRVMDLQVGSKSNLITFYVYAVVSEPKDTSEKAQYMGLFPKFSGIPKHHQWSGPRYIKLNREGYPTNAVNSVDYLRWASSLERNQFIALLDLQGKTIGKDVQEGPYTLTDPEDWIELFKKCLSEGSTKNKRIIQDMRITDNGDSSPSIGFDEQALDNCRIKMPKVSFTMQYYETWKDGNRTFLGELIHITSPFALVYDNLKNFFKDEDDAARFTFVSNEAPIVIVVDDNADAAFFVVKSNGLEYVAGSLSPFFAADINAASSFYPVIGNKVFMKPGCTTPIPWPSNNGNWYSYPNNTPENLSDCLYTAGDGWLSKWGIKSQNKDQGCSITWVLTGAKEGPTSKIFQSNIVGTSISSILNRLTLCIFDGIVEPALEWASELITNVAGLSMRHIQVPEIKIEYYS